MVRVFSDFAAGGGWVRMRAKGTQNDGISTDLDDRGMKKNDRGAGRFGKGAELEIIGEGGL